MPQLFHRSANALSRMSLVVVLVLVAGVSLAGYIYYRSSYYTGQREVVNQIVPFSHEHHVSGLGIDCRYCHFSVENSSFAGIPPTQVCMNCHRQIWVDSPMLEPVRESYRTGKPLRWTRVHNLPDHVFFNHSIHITKGIGCASCHGQVDRMPLTWQAETMLMEWCLQCHRNPERYVRPREEVFSMTYQAPENQEELGKKLVKEYGIRNLTHCSACHR